LEKKFHFITNPIRLYYVEDISEIVGGCCVLHNMMVKVRMDNDEEESGDMYELVPSAVPNYDVTAAEAAIDQDDAQFMESSVQFRQQKQTADLLGRQRRIVMHNWTRYADEAAHDRLRDAVKKHLYKRLHPNANVDDDVIGDYNPLADYQL